MEWYLIFVTGFLSFPTALAVILEGPKSSVVPEGSNVTLQCLATGGNRIVWEDINDNTVIFIDKAKNTRKLKFDNFVISNAEDNFSLTILNAQLSDEGFYSCEEGDERRSANVTIEAGPNLSILVNKTVLLPESRITITEDEEVFAVCKADGAKPSVHLKIKFGDNEWIETNYTTTNEGLFFTTETSRVVHQVKRTDKTVTCEATGQISIPSFTTMISINVLHKPTCVIALTMNVAECQCVSNPAVSSYNWYINGEPQSTEPSLPIQKYIPANITCSAANEVGTSSLNSRYVSLTDVQSKASTTVVTIIIAVVLVCVIFIGALFIIIVIVVYRRSEDSKDTTAQTTEENIHLNVENGKEFHDAQDTLPGDDEDNSHLPSTSGKAAGETEAIFVDANDKNVSSEPDQKDEEVKMEPRLAHLIPTITTVISHDWEIFAIEDLKLKPETVKEIIREHKKVSDQLSAALEHWATSSSGRTWSHLERYILTRSEVYNYYRQMERAGENSNEQFPHVAKFSDLLDEIVKYVGDIGAQRLSHQYPALNIDTFTDSQLATLTGKSFIKFLQEKKLLIDDTELLSNFRKALEDSSLLRASHLVETYINVKEENLEINVSSTETADVSTTESANVSSTGTATVSFTGTAL